MKITYKKSEHVNCGFTAIEVAAAIFLLTACIIAFSQLTVFVATQRAAATARQNVVDQLRNVFEQLAEVPTEKLIALDFDQTEYQQVTGRIVPNGKIEFSCEPAELSEGNTDLVQSFILRGTIKWGGENNGSSNGSGNEVSLARLLTVAGNEAIPQTEKMKAANGDFL